MLFLNNCDDNDDDNDDDDVDDDVRQMFAWRILVIFRA